MILRYTNYKHNTVVSTLKQYQFHLIIGHWFYVLHSDLAFQLNEKEEELETEDFFIQKKNYEKKNSSSPVSVLAWLAECFKTSVCCKILLYSSL